jgi:2-methylcitrate dehydratase PrpD
VTIARRLAAFCCRIGTARLPPVVEARARLCMADHLHAAMHGAQSDTGDLLKRYIEWSGSPPPGAIGAELTALYQGAMSAVHEIDDVHQDTSLHPGSTVIAAAMSAAAEASASGRHLLVAIVAGYEVAIRLSIAAGHRHYHFFHATATCGAVGAAAAASVVLDLSEEQTAHALGIAITSASGLWEGINTEAVMIKHLHPGFAAERGVRAAKLARLGLRAAEQSFEGEKGFLAALAQPGVQAPGEAPTKESMTEILLGGLGEHWAILSNIFKRYPFCLGCFEPLEGLRHILGRTGDRADEVSDVLVEASRSVAWMVGRRDPSDQFQAKFSAPYALALVLTGYDVERAPLPVESLADPAVRRWYPLIRMEGSSEFGRRRARVTVTWKDGSRESADRPHRNLAEADVWGRFSAACRQYLGERGTFLEDSVDHFASLTSVADLMQLVRTAMGTERPSTEVMSRYSQGR